MRYRISKKSAGRGAINRKEVALRINKSGLLAGGEQRYSVVMRFTEEAQKKATSSGFVILEVDTDFNRLYFITANEKDGYKLTASDENAKVKSFSFTPISIDSWRPLIGDYEMKKDVNDNTYYIDLASCPEF